MRSLSICLLAAVTSCAASAQPQAQAQAQSQKASSSSTIENAISAYNRADYGTSIQLLRAAINGTESKNADAHYYLASAYLQLGNKKEALGEYQFALRLAPIGQSAKFCRQAINHLTASSGTNTSKTDDPGLLPSPSSAKPPEDTTKTYPKIKISGLPSIPAAPKDDGPALHEILTWTLNQQSAYYLTAFNRKNAALDRLEQMQELLKRAESLASSAVPNARTYGESDDEMKRRVENGRTQLITILEPYKAAIDAAQKSVEQTNSIYETCMSAGRRMTGY